MFDRKWRPWEDGGELELCPPIPRRILAPESTWREPVELNEAAKELPERIVKPYSSPIEYLPVGKPRILVDCDLFAPFDGRWVDEDGESIWWDTAFLPKDSPSLFTGNETPQNELSKQVGVKPYTTADVLARVFRLIDSCPNLEWIVPTSHPERVREVVVDQIKRHGKETEPYKWDMLNIAVRVSTQAEADERIPAVLALRDLVGKVLLWAEPTERIDLTNFLYRECGEHHDPETYALDGVIISGKRGQGIARELVAKRRQSLIDQCEAAGVDYFIVESPNELNRASLEKMASKPLPKEFLEEDGFESEGAE